MSIVSSTGLGATFVLAVHDAPLRARRMERTKVAAMPQEAGASSSSTGSRGSAYGSSMGMAAAAVFGGAAAGRRRKTSGSQRSQKTAQLRQAQTLQLPQQSFAMAGLPDLQLDRLYQSYSFPSKASMVAPGTGKALEVLAAARSAVEASASIVQGSGSPQERLKALLCNPAVQSMLIAASCLSEFSHEVSAAFKDDLEILSALKQLKRFWELSQVELVDCFEELARQLKGPSLASAFEAFHQALAQTSEHTSNVKDLSSQLPGDVQMAYLTTAARVRTAEANAAFKYGSA
eukprot:gb/GFBE01079453.1/.p1 GENE.gb/GFBE01079453.1/~~gb/GFBE01079453.1/.p1  ORF type:complete len:290 (+),score=69.25 gb/GFBE01079453.1/:1-870(+)